MSKVMKRRTCSVFVFSELQLIGFGSEADRLVDFIFSFAVFNSIVRVSDEIGRGVRFGL